MRKKIPSEAAQLNDTGTPPRLSEKDETHLTGNFGQLATVEPNLLGVLLEQNSTAGKSGTDENVTPAARSRLERGISIYVSSCFNGEGKSTTAVQMAYSLTINGTRKVVLVDGNPRAPKIHSMFNTDKSPGLMEAFHSGAPIDSVVKPTHYNNLSIITFGTMASGRPKLFTDASHVEHFSRLSSLYDFIIFDGQSMMGSSDSAIIAKQFDGIVLVIESERTKWEVVQQVVDREKAQGSKIFGAVLNKRKFYLPRFLYRKF